MFLETVDKFTLSEETLMLGKTEGRRRREWQRVRWLDGIISSMDMSLSKHQEIVKEREAWYDAVHGISQSQTRLSDWTTIIVSEPTFVSPHICSGLPVSQATATFWLSGMPGRILMIAHTYSNSSLLINSRPPFI